MAKIAVTPNFGLPYPACPDCQPCPDCPGGLDAFENLARAVDTALAGLSLRLTDLEGSLPSAVVKALDETVNNSAVMQADDELRLVFPRNRLFVIRASIIHNSNSTADFKFQFTETTGSVGATGAFDVIAIPAGGAALTIQSGTLGTVFTGEGAGADRAMVVQGWVLLGGTNDGTLKVEWAQNTANPSNTVVKAGSWLEGVVI